MAEFYHGPHSQVHGVCATAKIQLQMELTGQVCHQVDLMGYRNNVNLYTENEAGEHQKMDLLETLKASEKQAKM